jgi:hypothetical protein
LRLELHWRPIYDRYSAALNFAKLINGASTVKIANLPLPAISLQDNILYLCGHGGHHFWSRVFWLVDLAEIIRQNSNIDWRQLMTSAGATGLLPQLLLGVVLAHKLLAALLPEAMRIQAWCDPLVSYPAQISCRYMLCPDPEDSPLSLGLHLNACRIRMANSFSEKLNFLQKFFLGRDWMTMGLPDALFFLHYLMRYPLWLQRKLRRGEIR